MTTTTQAAMDAAELMSFEDAIETFEPVLGFEVHVELNTASKMFSSAPNAFGDEPNTNVNEVDLGMPGTLPVVNGKAVESAIRLGLALNCTIAQRCRFARKQYFYPDTPKNWQTSQYDEPIAFDGFVDVELDDGEIFRVEIERAHMEEDAGKLTHAGTSGRIHGADYSLVDYNRAGVPLIEIVSKPVTGAGSRAPEIARAYVSTIRDIVKGLGISDARMERGNVRCDANVSLMRPGAGVFGTRSETKNVNSIRAVEHAVTYEIRRHAGILSAGGSIVQETRHWKEDTRTTRSGRVTSDAEDYRYFPEPDLVPIVTTPQWVESLRAELPEPPAKRRRRLREAWGYAEAEFRDVIAAGLLDQIEETVAHGASPAVARKWWMGEISRLANARDVEPAVLGVEPATIVELNDLIQAGTINDKIARQVLELHLDGAGAPAQIVQDRGLEVVSDDGALAAAVEKAMAENPDVVEKVKGGKFKAIGALIGPVMKETRGQADAGKVKEIVLQKLNMNSS